MHPPPLSFLALVLLILITTKTTADHEAADKENNNYHFKGIIGAIVDNGSRTAKEQRIAMKMAEDDFNGSGNQTLVLYTKNSRTEPVHAALAAMELITSQEVQAILGPQTWEETSSIMEIASNKQIPILSFAEAIPNWATEKWPFLFQASSNQFAQMKAIAAILQSWEWHQVNVIYEDIDSSAAGVIPHLSNALREVGAEIMNVLPLPPFPSAETITKELEKLKSGQCRVFVVHLSLELAVHLFEQAKKMEMMEKDYIWITTNAFTSLVHSIDASTISSMQGILGVRSYFPENKPRFRDFYKRFRKRFGLEYPEEDNHEPGALAIQAYDAVWSVALAMRERNKLGNQKLLECILHSDFDSLTGKFQFRNQKVDSSQIYQIINLIGNSYSELGFWTHGLGFSYAIDENATYNNSSMKDLGQVFWPGLPSSTPRGWTLPTSAKPLRIGVPIGSVYKTYVHVVRDELGNFTSFEGFSIKLFKAIVERLPFDLPYTFYPFNGSYDNLVKQIYLKKFDAVVGDVAIVAKRCKYADFTPPYTESGLVMIVPVRKSSNRAVLFVKPFTKAMWFLIILVCIYNGFVVWLIERKHWPEPQGSAHYQTGTLLWLSFGSIFSLNEKLHSNLSRMMMLVWLFVALIITQTYTANLSSMLTAQGLEPSVDNIDSLRIGNAVVGYSHLSFVAKYLEEVLHFPPKNLKGYSSVEDYAYDLRSGKTVAIFLEVAVAKIFLARYCKSFTTVGPRYKVGGFGFAFPKGSPLLPRVTEALLNVSESGKVLELETRMIASEKCMEVDLDDDVSSISPSSFWVLFILTGGTSTIALFVHLVHCCRKINNENLLLHKTIKMLTLALSKQWGRRKQIFCRRVSYAEDSPGSSPNGSEARIVSQV